MYIIRDIIGRHTNQDSDPILQNTHQNYGSIRGYYQTLVDEEPEVIDSPYEVISAKDDLEAAPESSPKTQTKGLFFLGCLLAFLSGLSVTINNFITKEAQLNFGEILAFRGIVQTLLMASVVHFQGEKKTLLHGATFILKFTQPFTNVRVFTSFKGQKALQVKI